MSYFDVCLLACGILLVAGACLLIAAFVQVARHGGLEPLRTMLLVGAVLGVVLLLVGIWGVVDHHRFLGNAESVMGTVVADQNGRKLVEFVAEGRTVQVPVERLAPGGLSSDRAAIVYPPGNPDRARLRGLMTRRYPAFWMFAGGGTLFVFVGLIAWRPSLVGWRRGLRRA